jgi:hypothetical protein
MKITGKRTIKVYSAEEKSENVKRKIYFKEAFFSAPKFKITEGFNVQLDQEVQPFTSCTISTDISDTVTFEESPKTVKKSYKLEVSGYRNQL